MISYNCKPLSGCARYNASVSLIMVGDKVTSINNGLSAIRMVASIEK